MQAHATPAAVSITVGAQSGILTYGTEATADFQVTVTQPGQTGSDITLSVTGLPTGASASWSINPVAASEGPGVQTILHITSAGGHGGTPAGAASFTVHNDMDISTGSGTLTVDKKPLTVSATGVNKTYDGTTAADVILSTDALADDIVTLSKTDANFIDKDAGTGKTVSVTGISISGADADNYELLSTSASTEADINQAPLKITRDTCCQAHGPGYYIRRHGVHDHAQHALRWRHAYKVTLFSDGAAAARWTGDYPIVASPPLVGTGLDNYQHYLCQWHSIHVNGSMRLPTYYGRHFTFSVPCQ